MDFHYYLSPEHIDMAIKVPFMIRKVREFFSAYFLDREIVMDKPHSSLEQFEKIKNRLYPKLFTIHWGQKQDEFKLPLVASMPFSFVDWKTMELIKEGSFDFDELAFLQVQTLCLNICPGLQTFPQFLANDGNSIEKFIRLIL